MMSSGGRNGSCTSPENTFKILVTSNVHLGFAEREQNRSVDSFVTFSEIIDLAKKTAVDFVLVTGNLFHEARPSRWAVHSALDLLRTNCLGSLPIRIECLNDWVRPLKDGAASLHMPNFVDPNINVELPVFVIHGFSDDPSGLGNLSELDTLDRAGMLNYYGKMTDNTSVHLQPLLLRKGTSMLALYTLGAVREELLGDMIAQKTISFTRPAEAGGESFFNLLAMHQPRKGRVRGRYPFADFVEPWMDLVVSGQSPVGNKDITNDGVNFRFIEPGSTIRTTLNEEEIAPKQVLLLEIYGKACQVESIALKTVRPLILDLFVWEKSDGDTMSEEQSNEFTEELKMMVQRVIERAKRERTSNPRLPWPPAVQITVENADNSRLNPSRLGQQFSDVAVNSKHMFKMTSRAPRAADGHLNNGIKEEDSKEGILDTVCSIDDAVAKTLREWEARGDFAVLTAGVQMKAMKLYVEKEDDVAIQDAYDWEKDIVIGHMNKASKAISVDETTKEIVDYHIKRCGEKADEKFLLHHTQTLSQPKAKGKKFKAPAVVAAVPSAVPIKKEPIKKEKISQPSRASTRSSSQDSEVDLMDDGAVTRSTRVTRRNGKSLISSANTTRSSDNGHESEPTSESELSSMEVPVVAKPAANGTKRGRGRPPSKKVLDEEDDDYEEPNGASQVYNMTTSNGRGITSRTSRTSTSKSSAVPEPVKPAARGRPRGRRAN